MNKPNPKQTLAQQALAAAFKALQDNPDLIDKAVEKSAEFLERVRKDNPEVDRALSKAEELAKDTWDKAPPHVQAAASMAANVAKNKAQDVAKAHGVDKVAERVTNKVKSQVDDSEASRKHRALAVKVGVVVAGLAVVYYYERRKNDD